MKLRDLFRKKSPVKKTRRSPKIIVQNDATYLRELDKRMTRSIGIQPSRLTDDFEQNKISGSISNAVRADADTQRNYARTLAFNSPHVGKAIQYQLTHVIGAEGITPQPRITDQQGNLNKAVNQTLINGFKRWGEHRHKFSLDKSYNWRTFSLMVEQARFIDGEVFIRIHESEDDFKVELISADRVPFGDYQTTEETYTRNGIEYDKHTKAPVRYYFKEIDVTSDTPNGQLIGVDASEVIHYFVPRVIGQQRGITELSSIMAVIVQYDEFIKSAIVQKRQAASSMGFITQDKEAKQDINLGLEEHDHEEYQEPDIIQEIEAGTLQKLPAGSDIKQFTATQGADDAASFSNLLDGQIAMGLGFYKQGYQGDTAGVNYSSARFGAMNEGAHFRNIQSSLQELVLMPLYEKWLTFMIRTDRFEFKMNAIETIMSSIAWTFPRRESVDPVKDTENDIKLVENGFKSASQVILDRGDDPEKVFAEIESEKNRYVPKQNDKIAVAEAPAVAAAENTDLGEH
ncbi:phage portal protein [Serratia marcescens]|uniref:phage portal protein n=1 Tax=Serratia marcescens TaxID=615 RepID=UPI001F14FA57|nr:phage portal protein [Serratia marcescens]MDP8728355.1 phage portal protein [Serratia marcescens]